MFGRKWLYQRYVFEVHEHHIKTQELDTLVYASDYPMGRIVRDSRLYTVGAGSQEIRRMLIGREFNEELKK